MDENKDRNFNIYNRLKSNRRTIEDVALTSKLITNYKGAVAGDFHLGNKELVIRAMEMKDYDTMRAVSNYFYRASGIYQSVVDYIATLYRYDWYIEPRIFNKKVNSDKVEADFMAILDFLDNSNMKKLFNNIALNVVKNGAYYCYDISTEDKIILQELPVKYCRSLYSVKGMPAVEFNVSFFDDKFASTEYRAKILKLFPKEIQDGYVAYRQGLVQDDVAITARKPKNWRSQGWILLDPTKAAKFSLENTEDGEDMPLFYNAIPNIIDLDGAEELDRRKQAQQLIKILVQKLPIDKNGTLIFDPAEGKDIHENAVEMLSGTIGVDILTTFADIEDIDLSDSSDMSNDAVKNASDAVYRQLGITKNLFATDGNLSTEKSIAVDEATMKPLLLQFTEFTQKILDNKNKASKKYRFKFNLLETTQFNYKELSDKYKSLVSLGFSKVLPQIALGHSQSSILNTAYFENEILNLSTVMIPPLQSSVMNAETLQMLGKKGKGAEMNPQSNTEDSKIGRPEKSDSEKSEKTIANQESQS